MSKKVMKVVFLIAMVLLVIGGLNWGLVGVGVGDVVAKLGSTIATIVYVLVGIAALYTIYFLFKE